jgi:isoleucyl-tRNA synthetase
MPGAFPTHRHRAGHRGKNLALLNFNPFDVVGDEGRQLQLPPSEPVFVADYATADDEHRHRHSSPAYGVDFNSCVANGIYHGRHPEPVQDVSRYVPELPFFGGLNIWKTAPLVIDKLREHGRLFATRHRSQLPARTAGA